jgi:hypothetical protein
VTTDRDALGAHAAVSMLAGLTGAAHVGAAVLAALIGGLFAGRRLRGLWDSIP